MHVVYWHAYIIVGIYCMEQQAVGATWAYMHPIFPTDLHAKAIWQSVIWQITQISQEIMRLKALITVNNWHTQCVISSKPKPVDKELY